MVIYRPLAGYAYMRAEGGRITSIDTSGSIWKKTVDIIMIIAVTDRSIRITETMVTTMATTMATIMVTADSTITTD
jgi:hypothetical protein